MNTVNSHQRLSGLIFFEIIFTTFYLIITIGTLIDAYILNEINFSSRLMFWIISAGSLLYVLLYHIVLITIPLVSIYIYRKKYLNFNLVCLISIIVHIIVFFYLLSGLARL